VSGVSIAPAGAQSGTGSLTVQISGPIPSGFSFEVNVSGPDGYSDLLTGVSPSNPETLNGLSPGTYTLEGGESCGNGSCYEPTSASQNAQVSAGQTTTSTIDYTCSGTCPSPQGSLTITETGLPSGFSAEVSVTGPNSYSTEQQISPAQPINLTDLDTGSYTITPGVSDGNGDFFYPTEASQNATVSANQDTQSSITYTTTEDGTAAVQVNDAPVDLSTYDGGTDQIVLSGQSGLAAGFSVDPESTGPYSLIPGTWSVSAPTFTDNGSTYTPVLSASSLTVTGGGLATLTVTYVQSASSATAAAASDTNQYALTGTLADSPLSVYVDSSSGLPESNDPVTFTVQPASNGATGTFSNGQTQITVNTNAQGVATTPFTSGSIVGDYQVSASASGATSNVAFNMANVEPEALSLGTSALTSTIDDVAGDVGGTILGAPLIGDTVDTAVQNSLQALISNPQQAVDQGGEFLVASVTDGNPVLSYACQTSSTCQIAAANGNQETLQTLQDTWDNINGNPFVWALSLGSGAVVTLACLGVSGGVGSFACVVLGGVAATAVSQWAGSQVDAAAGNPTMVQLLQNDVNGASQLVSDGVSAGQAGWQALTNAVATSVETGGSTIDQAVGAVSGWLSDDLSGAEDLVTNQGDVTATTTSQDVSATLSGGSSQLWVASLASPIAPSVNGLLSSPAYGSVTVASGSSASSGSVQQCGLPSGSALAYWSGTAWQAFSSQTESSGCVTAQISSSSQPSLNQMQGATTWIAGGVPQSQSEPAISSISQTSGPLSGGASVVITGTGLANLASPATVLFGSTAATVVNDTSTQIVATVPAGSAGTVNVSVTTPDGTATDTGAYTYLPATLTWSKPKRVDTHVITGLSCPTTKFCVAVDNAGDALTTTKPTDGKSAWTPADVDGTNGLSSISCPTVAFCAATDGAGHIVTSTDPAGGASAWTAIAFTGTSGINDIWCPSKALCVATTNSGDVITSKDPTGGLSAWTVTDIDNSIGLDGIACGTTVMCVAGDLSGNLLTSTRPTGPASAWSLVHADSAANPVILRVACIKTSLCVATDRSGDVITSKEPTGGVAAWSMANVDGTAFVYDVACATTSRCVASDNAGNVITSTDPTGGAAAWTVQHVDGSNRIFAISCPSNSLCLVGGDYGEIVAGT
jgi:hypothetical protein